MNSDGFYEELIFLLEVNVTKAGKFNLGYSIALARPDYHFGLYLFMWDFLNFTLDVGLQNITIHIPGGLLESSRYNGSYVINELAFGKDSFSTLIFYGQEIYFSPSFNSSQFNKATNKLNSYSINQVDINGNEIPEKLTVELNFTFITKGIFAVGIPIFNENQNELLAFRIESFGVSEVGPAIISLEFALQEFDYRLGDLAIFGIFGSWFRYKIPVFVRIPKGDVELSEPIVASTVSDHPVDLDGNGVYDALRITFSIDSEMNFNGSLFTGDPFSYPNETMVIIHPKEKNVTINKGINNLFIDFDLRMLINQGLKTPFFFPHLGFTIKEYKITQYLPYVNKNYNTTNFDSPQIWFSGFQHSRKFMFANEGGVEIIWEITAIEILEVTFEFDIRDYEPVQGSFSKIVEFTKQVNIGAENVSFKITAEDLYKSNYIGSLEIYTASIYLDQDQGNIRHRYQSHDLAVVDFIIHPAILVNVNFQDYEKFVDVFFIRTPEIELKKNSSSNLFDGFYVNTTLGFNNAGSYKLDLTLTAENDYFQPLYENITTFNVDQKINLSYSYFISAKTIVRYGFDNIVFGKLNLSNVNTNYVIETNIQHFPLNRSRFNYLFPLKPIGIVSDVLLDKNSDAKIEAIEVTFLINVAHEGNYGFSLGISTQLRDYIEFYPGNVTLASKYFTIGEHNLTVMIPYYYFLSTYEYANNHYFTPEIEVIVTPLYTIDNDGLFLLTTTPFFIEKRYNLNNFWMNKPLSIGFVRITQEDNNLDGVFDEIDVKTTVVIHETLPYFLKIKLSVYWSEGSKSTIRQAFSNQTVSMNFESIQRFFFSAIFPPNEIPIKYAVNASINVVSYDGILIDTYVTPFSLTYHTGVTSTTTTTTISHTTTQKENGVMNPHIIGLSSLFLLITLITIISGIFLLKKRGRYN
ncbi:MAG: hypothetical protein ACXABI_00020 [Candidatus Hodarchaeales archaeon]